MIFKSCLQLSYFCHYILSISLNKSLLFKFWVILGCFLVSRVLNAQIDKNLVAHFAFDSCDVQDKAHSITASSIGALTCDCGVSGSALRLSGGLNYADWESTGLQSLFIGDFSVSFYFKPDAAIGTMDILSKRENCGIDSFFAIRYIADQKTVVAELIQAVDNQGSLKAVLPSNSCWFHIVFTKSGNKLTLYLNGQEADSRINNYKISVANKARLTLANSPCLSVSDIRYSGLIDEIKLFNRSLTLLEIRSIYVPGDHILTQDTVIFKGSKVNVRIGQTCADKFEWFPRSDITNPMIANTVLSPTATTTYVLVSELGSCIIRDTLKVIVVDDSQLDCNDVSLPNAFTPNGDGLNDEFGISNPYVIEVLHSFDIFDRWGEKVFSSQSATGTWDGLFKGTQLNPGIFIYHLKYTCQGKARHKSGSFSLIK